VHDLFVLDHPEWYSTRYVRSHAPLLRRQLTTASALIAVSEAVATQLRSRFPGRPVAVAPNAPSPIFSVTQEEFCDADSGLPAFAQLLPGRYLLAVGSVDPRKNLSALIRAYSRSDLYSETGIPLVLVGGSSSHFRGGGSQAADGVVRLGYVTDSELSLLYQKSLAVVFPSLAEGFGLPLVEALASGARVAASDIDVFRWIAGHDASYFDPLSVEDISDALRSLVFGEDTESPQARSRRIRERFSWDQSAVVVMDLCRKIMEG